jgi:hypothetical protein
METQQPSLLERLLIIAVIPLVYALGRSLRIREVGRTEWGAHRRPSGPFLYALWHETILMSIWYHRRLRLHVMISASRDGELIARIARFFGYTPVRGSTSKGSLEATRKLIAYLRKGERGAITPDGPRGPRRRAQVGMVAVARLAGCPVVPFAFEAERCWRLGSWDRFIIPVPFSRAVFVYGEPIHVPRKGGSDEEFLGRIQRELDRVTQVAEETFASRPDRVDQPATR